eukprot:242640-Amphidinium_carterae.1
MAPLIVSIRSQTVKASGNSAFEDSTRNIIESKSSCSHQQSSHFPQLSHAVGTPSSSHFKALHVDFNISKRIPSIFPSLQLS